MRRFVIATTVLALGCGSLAACVSMGTNYDAAALDQIAPGTPMAEVIARLGQPNNRTTLADGQTQLLWLHSKGTAWGSADARSAALLFDAQGRFVRVITTSQTSMR